MEIFLKDLLSEVDYLDIEGNPKIDTDENLVIFGSNGIGKSTIYRTLKQKYLDYEFLDYDEMKDMFKKNKKKIEISLYINKIEELSNDLNQLSENLSITSKFKSKGITSKSKAADISEAVANKYLEKEFSELQISKKDVDLIKKTDNYIEYLLKNYSKLKLIGDISDELKLVDKDYLRKALVILEPRISPDANKCPVCGAEVKNLKELVKDKIQELSKIKSECLKDFIKVANDKMSIQDAFNNVLDVTKVVSEKVLIEYYLFGSDIQTIENTRTLVAKKKELMKELKKYQLEQDKLYNSLVSQKEIYMDYLITNYKAEVIFNDEAKTISVSFNRNIETYSTGEINAILFITKIFSYLGSEKRLMFVDDPISSYDLVNQYHIAYHLCKIVSDNKKVIIFTHNPDVINVINSQFQSAYSYVILDKINNKIRYNKLPQKMYGEGSIISIDKLIEKSSTELDLYLSIMINRNDKDRNDKLSSVLHFDEEYIVKDEVEYKGCSNNFFVNYIENDMYINGLRDECFMNVCKHKIITLTAMRVWVEYKILHISKVKLNGTYTRKINQFFKNNQSINSSYPKLTKENLLSKKVMLNQNCHLNSQVQPFYYALSVKSDDIIREVKELKSAFICIDENVN